MPNKPTVKALIHCPDAKDCKRKFAAKSNMHRYHPISLAHSTNAEGFELKFAVDPIRFQIARFVCMEKLHAVEK